MGKLWCTGFMLTKHLQARSGVAGTKLCGACWARRGFEMGEGYPLGCLEGEIDYLGLPENVVFIRQLGTMRIIHWKKTRGTIFRQTRFFLWKSKV